jgi:hypothetical protein
VTTHVAFTRFVVRKVIEMLGLVLALLMHTQTPQPLTTSETPTEQTKVVTQGIEWRCDRVAVIEYVRTRDRVVINYMRLSAARAEYRRLLANKERDEQEERRFAALTLAIATFPVIRRKVTI